MRFELSHDPSSLIDYLPLFVELAGRTRWKTRALQLANSVQESPFIAKIISDYYWLEMELSAQTASQESFGNVAAPARTSRSFAALYFAGTIVEVHKRLSPGGRRVLEGRIRDAMNPKSGFAPLYLEMEIAAQLMVDGFETEFPDLEGSWSYDLAFSKGTTKGEVECKSISFDAGRKIHRNDFYRFVEGITTELKDRAAKGTNEVILVTVKDRMPSASESQKELRAAVIELISSNDVDRATSDWFTIDRIDSTGLWGSTPVLRERDFRQIYTDAFGENCHVAGPITETGSCVIVARSDREDDHSKPLLEAMQKAITQLTGLSPGFVVVQFNDVSAEDLRIVHFRERVGIVSNYLFHKRSTAHVAGILFRPYDGLVVTNHRLSSPSIGVLNPCFINVGQRDLPFMKESTNWWSDGGSSENEGRSDY